MLPYRIHFFLGLPSDFGKAKLTGASFLVLCLKQSIAKQADQDAFMNIGAYLGTPGAIKGRRQRRPHRTAPHRANLVGDSTAK